VHLIFLFLAIATLVYPSCLKALGVILFVFEIAWFIVMLIYSELKESWRRRAAVAGRSSARLLACSVVVGWFY